MTEEVCARPGCGHGWWWHTHKPPWSPWSPCAKVGREGYCSCPSYRTQALQELADDVARHLGNLDDYGTEDLAALLRRTQELYP